MEQLQFYGQKLCCVVIMANFLRDINEPPEALQIALLLMLLTMSILKHKSYMKTLFVVAAVFFDVLFVCTHGKWCYVVAVIFCFLNLLVPVRHYQLPAVPDGVGYIKFSLPAVYGIEEACIFYPTEPAEQERKRIVDWMIPSFLLKMHGNDRSGFRIPMFIFKFVTNYMWRYKLRFSYGKFAGADQIIVFSHGLSANIHSYSALLTRLVTRRRLVITVQHSETRYSFAGVSIEERKKEIFGRAQDLIKAYDFVKDVESMKKLLGDAYTVPQNVILMGHSYGGGSIVQATSLLGDRKVKALVALDPWLAPVDERLLEKVLPIPCLTIVNKHQANPNWPPASNELFARANCPGPLIRLTLWKADHLHPTDLSFILGSMMKIVKHSEMSLEWLDIHVSIIEKFLAGVDKKEQLDDIREDIVDKFGAKMLLPANAGSSDKQD